MSQENVEIVSAAVNAFNRGDWDAALKDAAPNFEWDNSQAIGENHGVYSLDQMPSFWAALTEPWQSVRIEIDEVIEFGEVVILPHTIHVRGRDEIEVQARSTWVIRLAGGKIERICLYQEREQAL
jgi:ketosteroid isomerase-like protein